MSTSTNMNLTLPDVSVTAGPTYATNLNTALNAIDAHDHSSGKGVKVTPAGLNINSALDFGSQYATALLASRFTSQSAALAGVADKNQVYVVSGNLYYNNSSGTAIQLTSGSGLNLASIGTIGGDYGSLGVNASVSYSNTTKTYSFTQDPGVTANISAGPLSIFRNVASSASVTLQPHASIASSFTLTLPLALPASDAVMLSDSSGNTSFELLSAFSKAMTLTASGTALAITNNATIGGTLGVTGATSLGTLAVSSTANLSGNLNITGTTNISTLTASSVVVTDASKNLASVGYSVGNTNGYIVQRSGSGDINVSGLSATTGTFSSTLAVTTSIAIGGVVVPTISSTSTLTNKSLSDSTTFIVDDADATKKVSFQVSGVTTATTRTWSFPDVNDTFVGLGATQTLTAKTLTSPAINTATIIGGTINNASIGATTASTGAFTTLASSGAVTLGASTPGTLAHTVNHSDTVFTTGSTTSTTNSNVEVVNTSTTVDTSARLLVRADGGNVNGIFQAIKTATPEIRIGATTNHKLSFRVNNAEVGSVSTASLWTLPSLLVSGVASIADGSVSAPSLAFTGNSSNTGLYLISTDSIGVAINGALGVSISNTTGVVLGGAATAGTHSVQSNTSDQLTIKSTSAATRSNILFDINGTTKGHVGVIANANELCTDAIADDMVFRNNTASKEWWWSSVGTKAARLTSSGTLDLQGGISTAGNGSGSRIKWKILSSSVADGGTLSVAHGLTASDIQSVTGTFGYTGSNWTAGFAFGSSGCGLPGITSTNITVVNSTGFTIYARILIQYT